ncbi:recombination regulator RecX [Snodgrassella sp. CFCC 13594]|uniref:recombination regulator RecX n=1 Tax=Snodgrassella sp. CFCC 13594 TaxID=1775559 RepID=UPI0008363E34|nr:recombination regulator RecX [Snodgrassella sp. CFCC 13594]
MKKEISLRQRALNTLARQEISRAELARKLQPYADNTEVLTVLLDELAEKHWQSDSRYAESYVHSKKNQHGSRRIRQALKQKGLDDALIQTYLPSQPEQIQAAIQVLRKKYHLAPTNLLEKHKCLNFLAYRGFDLEVSQTALAAAWPNQDSATEFSESDWLPED